MAYKAHLRSKRKKETDESPTETEEERLKRIRTGYINKQHILVLASRGITARHRHLMNDLRDLMPHSKKDVKLDTKYLPVVNEVCDMKGCNGAMLFEGKGKDDLFIWFSKVPNGPSVKFEATNIHTMSELKFTGNCLKYSRPLLQFDAKFDEEPQWQLIKELFIQIFSTPKMHPRSKPFIDHIFTFNIAAGRIWFRNYQVTEEFKPDNTGKEKMERVLVEIGPRFVLNPIKIFTGSFFGGKLYENSTYVSPAMVRSIKRRKKATAYKKKLSNVEKSKERKADRTIPSAPLDSIFDKDWEEVPGDDQTGTQTEPSEGSTYPSENKSDDSDLEDDADEDDEEDEEDDE